jgi:hypothetical protein
MPFCRNAKNAFSMGLIAKIFAVEKVIFSANLLALLALKHACSKVIKRLEKF